MLEAGFGQDRQGRGITACWRRCVISEEILNHLRCFGYIVGGAFTSVPVGVSGDIRDPLVVPLGPGAITSEVLGIFERTLKLPGKLVAPLENQAPN